MSGQAERLREYYYQIHGEERKEQKQEIKINHGKTFGGTVEVGYITATALITGFTARYSPFLLSLSCSILMLTLKRTHASRWNRRKITIVTILLGLILIKYIDKSG
jgi:hypothetical protein